MAEIKDPTAAVIAFLLADTDVDALVSGRGFGFELERSEADSMPRKALVVRPSGAPNQADALPVSRGRYDVFSYGETPFQAARVRNATYRALKRLERTTAADALIQSAVKVGGPIPLRDPDTPAPGWPVMFESWEIIVADAA